MRTRLHCVLVVAAIACGAPAADTVPAEKAAPSDVVPSASAAAVVPAAPTALRIVGVEAYFTDSAGKRTTPDLVDNAGPVHWNNTDPFLELIIRVERPGSSTQPLEVGLLAREGEREAFAERRTIATIPTDWDGRVAFRLSKVGCRPLLLHASSFQGSSRAEVYRYLPFGCGE